MSHKNPDPEIDLIFNVKYKKKKKYKLPDQEDR